MFAREDIVKFSRELGLTPPKNLGDLIYSFRYRKSLPQSIVALAPEGQTWIIRAVGRAKYCFALVPDNPIFPQSNMSITKVPDATPGIVAKYALNDEQALLAKLRYNRLVDVFTQTVCYSLQSHLRSAIPQMGQVETDELYVGLDKKGVQYVLPVQAKGSGDRLSIVQIEQDFALCRDKFASLICRPIAAQFFQDALIVLFEFEESESGFTICSEKHYKLVSPDEITDKDLAVYQNRV